MRKKIIYEMLTEPAYGKLKNRLREATNPIS